MKIICLRHKLKIALAIFILPYFFVFSYAKAAEVGFQISHSLFDLSLLRGKSHYEYIRLENKSDVALPARIVITPWNYNEQTDDIEFIAAEPQLNAAKWFDIYKIDQDTLNSLWEKFTKQTIDIERDLKNAKSVTDLIINPKTTEILLIKINPPPDAAPGSYQIMVQFQPVIPPSYFTEGATALIPEIGAIFFINIPCFDLDQNDPKCLYGAEIKTITPTGVKQMELFKKLFGFVLGTSALAGIFEEKINNVALRVVNTGLFHFRLNGSLEIKNVFGRTIKKIALPARTIPAKRSRTIDIQLNVDETGGRGQPIHKRFAAWLQNQLYFGPYRATLALNLPTPAISGVAPITSEARFWIIPWKFWLAFIALLSGGAYIFLRGRKRIRIAIKVFFKGAAS